MKRLMTVFLMILCLLPLCAAAIAEPESAETTAQAITPEILAGLWELDHADSSGGIITAEQWISFFGENASMEFTPDGIWIMKAGGKTEIYFYEFVDGELFAEGGKAPLSFVNGQLIFDTGTPMAFAKSEKPGIAGTLAGKLGIGAALSAGRHSCEPGYVPDALRHTGSDPECRQRRVRRYAAG